MCTHVFVYAHMFVYTHVFVCVHTFHHLPNSRLVIAAIFCYLYRKHDTCLARNSIASVSTASVWLGIALPASPPPVFGLALLPLRITVTH